MKRSAVKVIKHFFPHLQVEDASKISVNQFKDGITNKLYKVEVSPPRDPFEMRESHGEEAKITLLMRVYGKGTEPAHRSRSRSYNNGQHQSQWYGSSALREVPKRHRIRLYARQTFDARPIERDGQVSIDCEAASSFSCHQSAYPK